MNCTESDGRTVFEIRPSGQIKALVLFPAIIAAAVSVVAQSWIVVVICAITIALIAIWWCGFAKITLDVTSSALKVSGPLYRRTFDISTVVEVKVAKDNGLNASIVNWPVTGRASSPSGVRLNMGGRGTCVAFRNSEGEKVSVVFGEDHIANRYATVIRASIR